MWDISSNGRECAVAARNVVIVRKQLSHTSARDGGFHVCSQVARHDIIQFTAGHHFLSFGGPVVEEAAHLYVDALRLSTRSFYEF